MTCVGGSCVGGSSCGGEVTCVVESSFDGFGVGSPSWRLLGASQFCGDELPNPFGLRGCVPCSCVSFDDAEYSFGVGQGSFGVFYGGPFSFFLQFSFDKLFSVASLMPDALPSYVG